MSNQELVAVIAVLGSIALFTAALTVVAVRVRRADDAESLALRAAQVGAQCGKFLLGPDFLWAVWHDTARAAAMKTLIRNARDEVITTVEVPSVPVEGVLKRFDLDGRHYEIRKASLMSKRTCLREAGRGEILLSADHEALRTRFYRGDGAQEIFVLPMMPVTKRFRPVNAGESEIGRLIVGLERNAYARVLTLPKDRFSLLEQVFLLASR
ncbi:MAG: hypothetical protein AB7Q97_13885 [Gammaproteobacteria bacterium]